MPVNLNNAIIRNIHPTGKTYELTDSVIRGLKVRVTKTGSSSYYLYYKINGKRRKYLIGTTKEHTIKQAREQAKDLRAEIRLGNDPQKAKLELKVQISSRLTLREFLDDHYYPQAENSHRSFNSTKSRIEFNFQHLMKNNLSQINKLAIDRWKVKRKKEGIKDTTLNRIINTLRALLNQAVEWEFIETNPLKGYKNIRIPRSEKHITRYLSPDEHKRLYKALADRQQRNSNGRTYINHLEPMVVLLHNTGIRPKEAMTLKWECVDFKRKEITVLASFSKTNEERKLPLNDQVYEMLKAWHEQNYKKIMGEWVFPGNDKRKHIVSIRKGWQKLINEAAIKDFRMYDLRHDFASRLVNSNISIYVVSQLLGHSSIEMTSRYAHVKNESMQSAVNVL